MRQSHSQLCTWEEAVPVSGTHTLGPCLPGKPGTPGGPRWPYIVTRNIGYINDDIIITLLSWIHDVICRSIIIPLIRSKQVYYSGVPVCRLDQQVPPLQPKWKEKTIIQLFNFNTSMSNYRWQKLHGHLCLYSHVE